MKAVRFGLVATMLFCGAHAAAAQTFDLQIRAEGNIVRADGGEQPSVGTSSGPLEIGKTTPSGIGKSSSGGCGLGASGRLSSDAVKGWFIEFTPTRVQGHTVTFHLRWTRVEAGKQAAPVDVDLTLRPGESIPIDALSLRPEPTDPPNCRLIGMTLRVRVDFWPPPERETRQFVTHLWLVERTSDGLERVHPLIVRGLADQRVPFTFAPLNEGALSLDLYGEVQASSQQGLIALNVTVRSRIVDGSQGPAASAKGNLMTSRKIGPVSIKTKPDEVVAMELPRLSDNHSGAFATRTLSLRLRTQQER